MTPEALGMDDRAQQTRAAAFRLLVETGRAVSAAQIAAELKAAPSAVEGVLRQLDTAGRIRLSAEGHVLGSARLRAAPAAHELWLGSRRGLANWGPLLSANRGIESREDDGDNG